MDRLRGSQKQKRTVKKFHHLVQSVSSHSRETRRSIISPRILIYSLSATVGVSALVFATQKPAPNPKISELPSAHVESTPTDNPSTSVNVQATTNTSAPPESPISDQSNTTVTINNQAVPIENGSVHRTYTDENGNTYTVDVSVNSQSTSVTGSSTDVSISSSSSSVQTARGSPSQ